MALHEKAQLFEMCSDDDSTGESREQVPAVRCVIDTYDEEAASPYQGKGRSFIKKLSLLIIFHINIIFSYILKYTRQGKRKSQGLELKLYQTLTIQVHN